MRQSLAKFLFFFMAFMFASQIFGNTDPQGEIEEEEEVMEKIEKRKPKNSLRSYNLLTDVDPVYSFYPLQKEDNPLMPNGKYLCEDRFLGKCWKYGINSHIDGREDQLVGQFARRWDNNLVHPPGYFSKCMNAQAFFALIVDVLLASNNPALARDVSCQVSYPKRLSGDDGFVNYFSIIANIKGTGHVGHLAATAGHNLTALSASACSDLILGFQSLVDNCDVSSEAENNALWIPFVAGGLVIVVGISAVACWYNPELGAHVCILSTYCLQCIAACGQSWTR